MYPNCTNLSYDKIFARNVKARREAMGLTRKELAEAQMGYPEELLARVESGDTTGCTIDFLVCLAQYLKVPMEALMTDRYFCPNLEEEPRQQDGGRQEEEPQEEYHLYLVVAGHVDASTVNPHHSQEIIAISEAQAIRKAIERDKNDGLYNETFSYFGYLQPSVLDGRRH